MSTLHLDCRGRRMMERYIADLQTIYRHVEFMSYNGKRLVVAVLAWKSVASTIIVVCGYGTITNIFRIMTARQIIYSSAIIVLGFFQFAPCVLLLGSTIIAVALGILYSLALGWFWSSTIIGRWYFRELWRSTLRLENLMSPEVWESWQVRKFCLETFG